MGRVILNKTLCKTAKALEILRKTLEKPDFDRILGKLLLKMLGINLN